ncbi:uncharacterized protein LOC134247700 [Saccostrea cucullata]|uniref:uncharacterized protein LOC134247700 n=1 Tax=Saccostrea cuccullata TaxID=36930 RepID=UPI002ED128D4
MGYSLQYNQWNAINWYIKTFAVRQSWSITEDIWLGIIKNQNSDKWLEVREGNRCLEKNGAFSKQNHLDRQCAVLNMSADSHSDNLLIYASPCDGQNFGFVCEVKYGSLPKDVEFYPMSKVLDEGIVREHWNLSSEIDCAIKAFSKFECYAATYFPEEGYCLAECSELHTIPITVSLVNSSQNSTVLLRAHTKVFINHTESQLPPSTQQYPCALETSTDTTTYFYQVSNSTTTDYMLTDATTKARYNCSCICPTNSMNISDEMLNQKVADIRKKLTVNKTSLSSTTRKKTSAPDNRQTSVAMGTVGICVITMVITSLVVSDFGYILAWIKCTS